MKVKDFKKYLNLDLFDDEDELSFSVCFTDSTDPDATQDWFPLELINDEAPEHLDFVFAPSCEKEIFKIFTRGLEE